MSHTGKVIIISGPSGVGKGTLIAALKEQFSTFHLAVSATTRPPREGEIDGVSYYFLSEEAFQKHIDNNDFLEWCPVHSHKYGTLKKEVFNYTDLGQNVILEIDVQGAQKIKQCLPEILTVFIAPPSLDVLEERLKKRNTDTEDSIKKRLYNANKELSLASWYDTVIVNTTLSQTISDFMTFIKKESFA